MTTFRELDKPPVIALRLLIEIIYEQTNKSKNVDSNTFGCKNYKLAKNSQLFRAPIKVYYLMQKGT